MENDRYVGIATFLSGALIFLALLIFSFLAWRAILSLRDRRNFDNGVAMEDPKDPWDQAISRPAADYYSDGISFGSEGGLGGMTQREQEELLLFCGTRKQQKAIRARRKAAIAGMNQLQLEEFLIHGSFEERKAIKERRKALSKCRSRGGNGLVPWQA